jgi:hypothetical protein
MDNVTPMRPPRAQSEDPLLIGPFETWRVVVDGRVIPRLTGFYDDQNIALVVDGRFSASFPPELARQAAWLLAQALAIGAGYTHSGATDKGQPFAPVGMSMDAPEAPRE